MTGFLPSAISEVTIAILLGLVAGRFGAFRRPILAPGVKLASERFLRFGIVLLGARLSLEEIARIGVPAIGVVAVTMTVALALVLGAARLAGIEPRLSVLLAVGTAVCGNSAAIATAPIVGARPRDVAYAVATITLVGTCAVFAYPLIGHALHLADPAFGLWAGVAVNDTSQVVATGAAYSPGALDVATVVKLIRNLSMAPLLIGIAWVWARQTGTAGDTRAGVRRAFPLFVLGFLLFAVLRSVGVIGPALAADLDLGARSLILVALVAVGLSVRLGELRSVGAQPLGVGIGAAVVVGAATLLAIVSLGLASGLQV